MGFIFFKAPTISRKFVLSLLFAPSWGARVLSKLLSSEQQHPDLPEPSAAPFTLRAPRAGGPGQREETPGKPQPAHVSSC